MLKQVIRRSTYGLVDIATRRRGIARHVNGLTIRFPPEVSRYYPPSYEPSTHAFIARHTTPGSLAVDAGAHIGLFTVLMAQLVGPQGRVLSFEPTATTFGILRRTVALNDLGGVADCRQEAVSRSRGHVEFYVDEHDVSNANSTVRTDRAIGSVRVPSVSIDDLAAEHPQAASCLKIDVEGAELEVLRGAAATLGRDRPALALDIHPPQLAAAGGTVAEVWDLLADAGYALMLGDARLDRDETVARTEIFELHAVAAADSASDSRASRS
jgi:FkbM family methyltransferase